MSNNPNATLARPQIQFCLATRSLTTSDGDIDVICTRIDDHPAHCCDEIAGLAWNAHRNKPIACPQHYGHDEEKGLSR